MNQEGQQELKELVIRIHGLYFKEIKFKEIDYIPGEALAAMMEGLPQENKDIQDMVFVADECLVFTEKGYDRLYNYLLAVVAGRKHEENWVMRNMAADLLMAMNGQNEKVYNLKKSALQCMIQQLRDPSAGQHALDIERELALNAAVIMKFKKSSSCYEYRMKLMEYWLAVHKGPDLLEDLQERESKLMSRILDRFPRNYFCWMYRLRLFKALLATAKSNDLLVKEAEMMTGMLRTKPNDYSLLSYFRFLLRQAKARSISLEKDIDECHKVVEFCRVAYEQQSQFQRLLDFLAEVKQK